MAATDRNLEGFSCLVPMQRPGTVSLVGAGPGDPVLISVKGALRVAQADVVLHDGLLSEQLLRLVREGAEVVFVGKRRGAYRASQEQTQRLMIERARAGLRVVRLKGGDPFVFGRGGEECEALAAAGVEFEVVPGVTAAVAAPAYAGIPMTYRGTVRTFAVVTGHADPADDAQGVDFAALAKMGTVAFYMGHMNLRANCDRLMAAGMDAATPAAVIERGTNADQRTVVGTVRDIAAGSEAAGLRPPVMVLIGCVVELRSRLNWFEALPLFGQRVLVTRTADQAGRLVGELMGLGAEVMEAPTIRVVPMENYGRVDAALQRIGEYAWLVLTSANGVEAMVGRLRAIGRDARALSGVRVAAIGSATAEMLRGHFIEPDLVPEEFVAERLAAEMVGEGVAGKRVLMLRADIARATLNQLLEAAGAACDDLAAYRTVRAERLPEDVLEALREGRVDWATFTSSSTFTNFTGLLGEEAGSILKRVKLASIGPITSKTIREAGVVPCVEAKVYTIDGLVEAMRSYGGAGSTGGTESRSR